MSEQTDDFLAHYGVAGMKWGRRKGGLVTRAKSAASDRIARREQTLTKASARFAPATSKKQAVKRVAAFGVLGAGPGRAIVAKSINKSLASVQADKARIDSGKYKAKDFMRINTAEMFVSARPKD